MVRKKINKYADYNEETIYDLKWEQKEAPLTDQELIKFEKEFPYKLPKNFINLLKISNGGELNYDYSFYEECLEEPSTADFAYLYGINKPGVDNDYLMDIKEDRKRWVEDFPKKNIVAFSRGMGTGMGTGRACFDYRKNPQTDNPPIVYWSQYAREDMPNLSFVANNFDEFINILVEGEPSDEPDLEFLKAVGLDPEILMNF